MGEQQLALLTTLLLPYLEVKDPRVVFNETLVVGYDSEKQALVQGQASNGCEKPAVTCRQAWGTGHRRGLQLQGRKRPNPSRLLHFSEEQGSSGAHCPTSRSDHTEVSTREGRQQALDNAIDRVAYTQVFLKAAGNSSISNVSSLLFLDLNGDRVVGHNWVILPNTYRKSTLPGIFAM